MGRADRGLDGVSGHGNRSPCSRRPAAPRRTAKSEVFCFAMERPEKLDAGKHARIAIAGRAEAQPVFGLKRVLRGRAARACHGRTEGYSIADHNDGSLLRSALNLTFAHRSPEGKKPDHRFACRERPARLEPGEKGGRIKASSERPRISFPPPKLKDSESTK